MQSDQGGAAAGERPGAAELSGEAAVAGGECFFAERGLVAGGRSIPQIVRGTTCGVQVGLVAALVENGFPVVAGQDFAELVNEVEGNIHCFVDGAPDGFVLLVAGRVLLESCFEVVDQGRVGDE